MKPKLPRGLALCLLPIVMEAVVAKDGHIVLEDLGPAVCACVVVPTHPAKP